MYPKNAASPQRVAIGPVVQISDGAVQTSGVSVKVMPQGGAAGAGGGTIAYEEGIVHYVPTQAETNYASFMLIAYKTGCIPATCTVVTSASTVAGHAGVDWSVINAPTTTVALSGTTVGTITTYTGNTVQTGDSFARIGATGSGLTSLSSQSSVDDLPTNAELATALAAADDAVLAAIADIPTVAEFEARTPSAAQLANIVSTGADWINGGRLDLILDDILLDTGTTLPGQIDDIGIKKNTAFSNFEFLMVLAADHVTPATGLTVTGQRSIDGAAFASVSGTIAEVSNGIYQFDAAAADTNGDVITWRFSSATADDAFITFKTVA